MAPFATFTMMQSTKIKLPQNKFSLTTTSKLENKKKQQNWNPAAEAITDQSEHFRIGIEY